MRNDKTDVDATRSAGSAADATSWIVAIAHRQDRDAFAKLFEFFAPRIKSWLMRRGATPDAAEETAQDALLAVWKKASLFDPQRATAAAWIFTIARNQRIDKVRRETRERLSAVYDATEQDQAERPDDLFDADQSGERVRASLSILSADQLQVVQLSFFEGRAHSDIAQRLNLPLGTVKSRLRLAMRSLREQLGDLK